MIKALTSNALSGVIRAWLMLAVMMYLATLNRASAYGLYALALPFSTLAAIVFDAGFGPLVVRPATISRPYLATLQSLAVLVGLAAALLLWGASFVVPFFFPEPRLPLALRILSVTPFLGMTAAVPRATLERELRYDVIAKVEVAAVVCASTAAIAGGLAGAGVWSYFTLTIVQVLVRSAAFNLIAPEPPSMQLHGVGGIYAQAKWITAQNLQIYLNRNSDNLLIGAYLGSAALGLYALAYQVVITPLQTVAWPFGAVLLSRLRRLTGVKERADAVNGVMALCLWSMGPVLAVAAMTCPELVRLLLKPSWQPLPPLIRLMCLASYFQIASSFLGMVLISNGELRLNFVIGMVNTACLLAIFCGTIAFGGLTWLVALYAAYSVIWGVVGVWLTYRKVAAPVSLYAASIAAPVGVALAIVTAGALVELALPGGAPRDRLLVKFAAFATVIGLAIPLNLERLRRLLVTLAGVRDDPRDQGRGGGV